MSKTRYTWAAPGDVNAFFGLMLDNIADLLLTVGLLAGVFGFPTHVALRYMVPGTAIGVFVGDMLYFWLALRLMAKTGRTTVTAMPLGLDTPSTFGMVFFVLGPAFVAQKQALGVAADAPADDPLLMQAALGTWHIGIAAIFISGLFKLICAFASNWIRQVVPRAGLLGSLAGISLVLISFLPFLEVLHYPMVGLLATAILLTTLVARLPFPGRLPGALASLLVAGGLHYLLVGLGWIQFDFAALNAAQEGLLPFEWLGVFRCEWVSSLPATLPYLPLVIPFALGTVVGGIDCTESASAAGDDFDTREVIGVEAIATIVAALCGGVIQTTPYIGHPAYKAMGGRAAYTLATALFVGGAGVLGYFGYLYAFVPKSTVFPILVFIGLEITAQSFRATPTRHYAAVALACVPALAALGLLYADKFLGEWTAAGLSLDRLSPTLRHEIETTRILANGFIVTSLLWASALAALIDRRFLLAANYFAVAGMLSCVGVIHSPLPGAALFLPWNLAPDLRHVPLGYAAGYFLVGLGLSAWFGWLQLRRALPEPYREERV